MAKGMNHPETLGFEIRAAHGLQQVDEPDGGINQGHSPSQGQQVPTGAQKIAEGRCDFVPGDLSLPVGADSAGGGAPVRRVTNDGGKGCRRESFPDLPNIAGMDGHSPSKSVSLHIPTSSLDHGRLDLQSGNRPRRMKVGQNQSHNPIAGTEVGDWPSVGTIFKVGQK
jgi:hypothetical protein